jgi:ribokinase
VTGRIVVVGDALLDVHATPGEPIRPGADVPAAVRLGTGGQGANLAVRLARRGLGVRLVSAIGDDAASEMVRGRLARAGVELLGVPSIATGAVVILLDAAGERTMLSQRLPFATEVAGRVTGLDPPADWAVVSGYLLEEPGPVLTAAMFGGALRAVIGSPFRDPAAWRANLEALAPDLVVLNRGEASALVDGASTAELAAAIGRACGATVVVVTEATGAAAASDERLVAVSNDPDPGAIDTTGAGDAFAATLIADLGSAWPPSPEALQSGLAHAAEVARAASHIVGAQAPVTVAGSKA